MENSDIQHTCTLKIFAAAAAAKVCSRCQDNRENVKKRNLARFLPRPLLLTQSCSYSSVLKQPSLRAFTEAI